MHFGIQQFHCTGSDANLPQIVNASGPHAELVGRPTPQPGDVAGLGKSDRRGVIALKSEVWRIDGTSIPVWTSGTGPKLLIVHGEATNHASWDRVRRCLNRSHTVITMDRRATFEYPFAALDMEKEIRDVAVVAESFKDDLSILAHSSGALCALGAAALIPRLGHLILYEPPFEREEALRPAVDRLDRLLRRGDLDGLVDAWLTDYLRMPREAADSVKHSEAGSEIRRFASYLPREAAEHLGWRPCADACASLNIPVTYLVGADTPEDDREYRGMITELEQLVPDLRVRELAGERHFAHFSNPELLARTVREILAG